MFRKSELIKIIGFNSNNVIYGEILEVRKNGYLVIVTLPEIGERELELSALGKRYRIEPFVREESTTFPHQVIEGVPF
jgi:hypothetical protein